MRESRILKTICYLLMPVLILITFLAVFSITAKESVLYNEEKYFESKYFVDSYTTILDAQIYELIHDNSLYRSVKDGEMEIYYTDAPVSTYYPDIVNMYFLITYKTKAFTNVELTNTTNTIEDIKLYIKENQDSKQVNIINGKIESESEIIQKMGLQYLDKFTEPYYTLQIEDETNSQSIEYITAYPQDFQIYSSYVEKFKENSYEAVCSSMLERLEIFEEYSYIVIPIGAILLILIFVYLVISIGYKKGVEGISLNDFDKIPMEIILIISIIIGCIPFMILAGINENYNAIISLWITAYLIIYVICAIIFDTTIKRIKSKTFMQTTIIGKMGRWIKKLLIEIKNKLKEGKNTLTHAFNVAEKVIIRCVGIIILEAFIILIFHDSFLLIVLEALIISRVIYLISKTIVQFYQIENKLKEMYDGNNQEELEESKFTPEFKNSVKYINNISNGIETAIQERMKSERLKAELITNVSHDIKTPLTSIINYVDLLKQEDIKNEKAKEYIGILDNKSQRLKKLTEDLVEASKVSTGNISLNFEKINVVELINQALGEFQDKFEKRGLKPIITNVENEINIMADSRYMYRIIENLFSNIEKYALTNSRIYIDMKIVKEDQDLKNVIIEVKNISKDRLNISAEELMQRFVRGDKSRTTEGSGLGISIAQNLTELQNGEFNLKLDGDLFKVELIFETC